MKFEHYAAFLEEMTDHLVIRYEQYMLTGQCVDKDKLAIIRDFVNWSISQDKEDLIVPRGRHGKSYQEMRNDEALK